MREARQLRRLLVGAFIGLVVTVAVSQPLAPFWVRLAVIIPVWAVVITVPLRRALFGQSVSSNVPLSQPRDLMTRVADAQGGALLWTQLVVCAVVAVVFATPLVPYDAVGWQKYAASLLGAVGVVYTSYQLALLRTAR